MKKRQLNRVMLMIAIICAGCQKSEPGRVEIYLLSKELHCRDTDGKSSYQTDEEIGRSRNVIQFKIVNNTNKIQLLLFNPYDIGMGNLMPEMKHSNGMVNKYFPGIVEHFDDPDANAYHDCRLTVMKDEFKLYENLGIKNIPVYIDYRASQILLYPGEERSFSTAIYLPVLTAYYNRYTNGRARFNGIKDGDSLYLRYAAYVPRYKNALPDWEMNDLKAKGVSFFADTIKSNAIAVKLIK